MKNRKNRYGSFNHSCSVDVAIGSIFDELNEELVNIKQELIRKGKKAGLIGLVALGAAIASAGVYKAMEKAAPQKQVHHSLDAGKKMGPLDRSSERLYC